MIVEELRNLHIISDPKAVWWNWLLGMINIYPENATFATQNKNEEIVVILRKHIITNFSWIVTSIFLIILPLVFVALLKTYDQSLNNNALLGSDFFKNINPAYFTLSYLFYLSFVISYAYFKFIHWYFDLFMITNERYISIDFDMIKGRQITDIPLTDIIDISEKVFGFFPAIIGYGNIEFKTTSEKISIIDNVPQTIWIRDSLSDLIRYIRKIKVVKSKENTPTEITIGKRDNEDGESGDNNVVVTVENGQDKVIVTKDGQESPQETEAITDIVGDVLSSKDKNVKIEIKKNTNLEP